MNVSSEFMAGFNFARSEIQRTYDEEQKSQDIALKIGRNRAAALKLKLEEENEWRQYEQSKSRNI